MAKKKVKIEIGIDKDSFISYSCINIKNLIVKKFGGELNYEQHFGGMSTISITVPTKYIEIVEIK